MDVINLTTKQTKKIDNQTAEQARCERWEKEAASTNATADHLEDQVLIVHVMMILCTVIMTKTIFKKIN